MDRCTGFGPAGDERLGGSGVETAFGRLSGDECTATGMVHGGVHDGRIASAEQDDGAVGRRQVGEEPLTIGRIVTGVAEVRAVRARFDPDVGRQYIDMTRLQGHARLHQGHRQGRGTLHLPDELVVATAFQPLLDQHRLGKTCGQFAEQLAHRVRAADTGKHEHRARWRRRTRRAGILELHVGDAQLEFVQVAPETVVGGRRIDRVRTRRRRVRAIEFRDAQVQARRVRHSIRIGRDTDFGLTGRGKIAEFRKS